MSVAYLPQVDELANADREYRSTSALESGSFRPTLAASRPLSSNNYLLSPVDMVGPSPVTSIGTEVTEIDDEEYDEVRSQPNDKSPDHHHPQVGDS